MQKLALSNIRPFTQHVGCTEIYYQSDKQIFVANASLKTLFEYLPTHDIASCFGVAEGGGPPTRGLLTAADGRPRCLSSSLLLS